MEQPLVSIVTITRNRGNMLRRCIKSVLAQTYTNIEHIVVDGASDDNTDEVISEFKDERLRFVKLESNWPIKETIDYGVSLCKGKYISFLDSDDEYLPQKIEKQVDLIERLPEDYGFVYCWMTYHDSSNNNTPFRVHKPELRGNVGDEVVRSPVVTGTPTLLFRLDFFRSFGGWKSKEEIGIVDDWEMCARACQLTKVDYVPESLVNVYINHGSVRQSEETSYYDKPYERLIKYHDYFLTFFADVFKRHPDYAQYHYHNLTYSYAMLRQRKKAFVFFRKYIRTSPSFSKASILLLRVIIGK